MKLLNSRHSITLMFEKRRSHLLVFVAVLVTMAGYSQDFHVSTTGDDTADGSQATPWESIQYAMDNATAGSTVYVHGGTYNERLYVNVSGEEDAYITFRNWETDQVIIDGEGTTDPALIEAYNVHHIIIDGFILRNNFQADAMGVLVEGACDHITLRNLEVYDIGFTDDPTAFPTEENNAQPIIVYGSDSNHTITDLAIIDCEIHHCILGYSEALAVNGNVEGFEVSDNEIYMVTNIGIDIIGHEGVCEDPALDQARQGLVSGNTVYDFSSPYATAAGIYVDGGNQIIVERNEVYAGEWGIEVGCENVGKSASEIIVRSNFIHGNRDAGIAVGGYDYPNGSGKVTDLVVAYNSVYRNGMLVPYNGEIYFTYIENGVVTENIVYVDNGGTILLAADGPASQSLLIDNNLFFSADVENNNVFFWYVGGYQGTGAFNNGTGNCSNCPFGDPKFVATGNNPDLHLQSDSPALDQGMISEYVGTVDFDGEDRISGIAPDFGADEFGSSIGVSDQQSLAFALYPNPSADSFSLLGWGSERVQLEIYDMVGGLVKQVQTMTNTPVDVRDLAKGSYVVVYRVGRAETSITFIRN